MGGELIETPQKATKLVPKKINLVNQQPPKPTHQTNPEPTQSQAQTQTHTSTPQMTIPEPVVEAVVTESVQVTESEQSVLLEQGCFTSHLLSFDNNKVLKIINWIC